MPIRIPNDLPAASALRSENIFVMTDTRAKTQDIRPLKILLLNLMPTKSPPKHSWRACWATRRFRWSWSC